MSCGLSFGWRSASCSASTCKPRLSRRLTVATNSQHLRFHVGHPLSLPINVSYLPGKSPMAANIRRPSGDNLSCCCRRRRLPPHKFDRRGLSSKRRARCSTQRMCWLASAKNAAPCAGELLASLSAAAQLPRSSSACRFNGGASTGDSSVEHRRADTWRRRTDWSESPHNWLGGRSSAKLSRYFGR